VLPLHETMGSAWNILASLGLWWWQHMIVRGLYEHCIAAEYIFCRKTSLIPRISYVHHILPFLSNCVEHNFLSKSHFLWQSTRLKIKGLTVLQYIHPACFFPMPSCMWHLPASLHVTVSLLHLLQCTDSLQKAIGWQHQTLYG